MENKNRVKLKISGSEFTIIADESPEYIKDIANMVDLRIRDYTKKSQKMSISMAAILSSINFCDELQKEKRIVTELLKKADTCEAEAHKATTQLADFAVANARLKEEKDGLHRVIEELKKQLQNSTPAAQGTKTQSTQGAATAPAKPDTSRNISSTSSLKGAQAGQKPQGQKNGTKFTPSNKSSNKINYQGNNQISPEYRRDNFSEPVSEEEMLSFFDQRDKE